VSPSGRRSSVSWGALFAAATAARLRAYAPYSQFLVGAAVQCEDGIIISGCNVENASYGLSICAERSAIARMVLEGRQRLRAVAIVVDTPVPTPPCGMCRQVMREFADEQVPVRSRNLGGKEVRSTVGRLLPMAFTREFL
jgi:cytidine deaminase